MTSVRILLLVVIGILSGCNAEHQVPVAKINYGYITYKSEIGDVKEIIPSRGILDVKEQVVVGSEVSGNITKVYVKIDQKVKKGDLLATIDPEPFEAAVNQSLADLQISQAVIELLSAELNKIELQYERRNSVADKLDEPLEVMDNLQFDVVAGKARIKSAKARLTKDRAQLQARKFDLKKTKISSPISGFVFKKNIKEGSNINARLSSPELFVIASDIHEMQIIANVSELDINRLFVGMAVRVRIDAVRRGYYFGKLTKIEKLPTKRGNFVTYRTIISLLEANNNLLPGMTASLEFIGVEQTSIPRIPIDALYYTPDNYVPDIRSLGLTEDEIPFREDDKHNRKVFLNGYEFGLYNFKKQRRIFILKDGMPLSVGIRVIAESENYVGYIQEDLDLGTPVITDRKIGE